MNREGGKRAEGGGLEVMSKRTTWSGTEPCQSLVGWVLAQMQVVLVHPPAENLRVLILERRVLIPEA